ncbi:glycosyltransferase family 4 protein, partial [Hyphobacterium sp. SN044]|uniref:glycosyltransferase family 4 protein n=1 Tax=Hyphobacterium sp. SN044 TaxID=2912575 RepID=UPI001F48B2D4
GLLAASLARVPVVIATAQQYMQPPWGRTVYAQQQLCGAGVHRYVAVSEVVAQQLNQTFHVPVKKICVIHNSVPGAAFNRSPNLALRIRLTRGV